MTSAFNWNVYRALPDKSKEDTSAFDWDRYPSAESTQLRDEKEESFPKEFARSFTQGMTPQLDTEGAKSYKTQEALASPEQLPEMVENDVLPSYSDLPLKEEIEDFLQKTFGDKGESSKSKYAQRIGQSLGTLAQTGAFTPSSIAALGTGAGLGELVEQKTGDPLMGFLAEIGGSGFTGLLQGAAKKIQPNKFIEAGKKLGLSEKTIAPLSLGEKSKSIFSKLALKGKKTESFLKDSKQNFNEAFENLHQVATELPALNEQQTENIISKFTDVTKEIKKTLANSPDEKNALMFIDEAIDRLYMQGSNPAELENFYRTLNDKINWGNMSRGDVYKNKIKYAIKDTFREINPEFSKDFESLNDYASKFYKLKSSLSQTDMQKALQTFNDMRRLGQIGWGLVTLEPTVLLEALGEKGFQIYARESLINPTIQKLNKSLINAAKKGSEKHARILINKTIEHLKKEHPKDFQEVEINR